MASKRIASVSNKNQPTQARMKAIRLPAASQKQVIQPAAAFATQDFPPLGKGPSAPRACGAWAGGIEALRSAKDLPDPTTALVLEERRLQARQQDMMRECRRTIVLDDAQDVEEDYRFPRMKASDLNTVVIGRHMDPEIYTPEELEELEEERAELEAYIAERDWD